MFSCSILYQQLYSIQWDSGQAHGCKHKPSGLAVECIVCEPLECEEQQRAQRSAVTRPKSHQDMTEAIHQCTEGHWGWPTEIQFTKTQTNKLPVHRFPSRIQSVFWTVWLPVTLSPRNTTRVCTCQGFHMIQAHIPSCSLYHRAQYYPTMRLWPHRGPESRLHTYMYRQGMFDYSTFQTHRQFNAFYTNKRKGLRVKNNKRWKYEYKFI